MALSSYSDLVSELTLWLNRSDLAARIPTFIRLFEAKINRRLRSPEMERTFTFTTVAGTSTYNLNETVRQLRTVYLRDNPAHVLTALSPARIVAFSTASQLQPAAYAVNGETIVLAPTPDASYIIAYAAYAAVAGLDDGNTTNWLLTDHPDAYLAGTLAAAFAFERDDEQAAKYDAILEGVIDEIKKEANQKRLPAGPLQPQPAVRE